MNDTWEFSKNNLRKWRWRRISPKGDVMGSGPRGYKNKADCEANARYNGWETGDTTDQDLVETLTDKANESSEESNSSDHNNLIDEVESEQNSTKSRFGSKLFIQQNLLKLIATFLGLMLLVLILILLKKDPEPELSDKKISNIYVLVDQDLSSDSGIAEKRLPRELST